MWLLALPRNALICLHARCYLGWFRSVAHVLNMLDKSNCLCIMRLLVIASTAHTAPISKSYLS